ncbi:unnamed protein product [Paramecium primaurelia]|uniref:Inhibitor of apoptosis-promoting Bax1 protein n=1 Tax=Paramecium primaurelia TaxID=5886 RepID=A0A8S1NDY0_PARPR|nr:unnamed protein product [Paramecium primaurelia]
MNSSFNNQSLDQNGQQQYVNQQFFETSGGNTQKITQSQTQDQSDNFQLRAQFFQKMYVCVTIEFAIYLVIISLGFHTNMGTWLITLQEACIMLIDYCTYSLAPTVLFYISLIVSLLLQFTLYFSNCAREAPLKQIVIILYQVSFGLTITTISIFMAISFLEGPVWMIWGNTLLIILMFTIFGCVKQSEITWKIGAIIIVGTTIPIMIILILIDTSVVWQKIVGAVIVITYGFYLILDTKFMMNKGRINLENEYWRGSLLLSGLMFQPLVRIIEYLFDIFRNRNR